MASPELAAVVEMLRANPPLAGDGILEMRAGMDQVTANLPRTEGVRYEPVDAGGVPAEWITAPEARDDHAVVYLHGGGYCLGNLDSHRPVAVRISQAARTRVLLVDYRLAPEHAYPAALEDAVAAVRFTREGGIAAEQLAVAGDSAGGGLAVACLLALRDAGEPLPAAGACISPWTDLAFTGGSLATKADVDPVTVEAPLRLMATAYLAGADPETPTASPLYAKLEGLPPLLVQVGTAEILLDDALRLAERARAAGVDVQLDAWDDMIHVWHAFADLLPEARRAIEELAAFLEARWA